MKKIIFLLLGISIIYSCSDDSDSEELIPVNPKLLIGTSSGKILQIDDVLQNPTITLICDLPGSSTDVAVNSEGEFFTSSFGYIKKVNESDCNLTDILDQGGNSLSFDTQNNLYINKYNFC